MSRVELSPKQTLAWNFLTEKNGVTEVFMGGAAGPGKSFLGCLWQIHNRIAYPGTIGAIGRKTRKSLLDTTFKTFKKVSAIYDLEEGKDWRYNDKLSRIIFDNGSEIHLVEMFMKESDDEGHQFGSLELTDAFIDEAPECREVAITLLASRIREKLINDEPKLLCVGNPAANWAKWRWIKDKKGRDIKLKNWQRVVRARLIDNPDPEFRRIYMQQLKKMSPYHQARLIDGSWDALPNASRFFMAFDPVTHVKQDVYFDEFEPIYLSFDFNYSPTTCIAGQLIHGEGIRIAREHVVDGGTEKLCEDLLRHDYTYRQAALYVTGDFSGSTRTTKSQSTDYEIIAEQLGLPMAFFKSIGKANKSHEYSFNLCHYVLTNIPIEISGVNCPELINDLSIAIVEESKDGKMKLKKDRETYKMDLADAFRYLIDCLFPGGIDDARRFAEGLL